MAYPVARRLLLAGLASGLVRPAMAASAPIMLTAGRRTLEVNGRAASVFGITQPNGTHGLTTETTTPFRVDLHNMAGEPTLIHWHGLSPPSAQDGVPFLSAPPIAPGGMESYDFPLRFPGTFWMHSHAGLQEQALMTAPLIIHDATDPAMQEIVLMLHDFSFDSPRAIFARLSRPAPSAMPGMAMDLNDVAYDAFLANDRTLHDPEIVRVAAGATIRLRIINGAASSNFVVTPGGLMARLIAVDGRPVWPVSGTQFPLAMAQRIDVLLTMPRGPAAIPVLAVLEGERAQTGIVLTTAGARIGRLDPSATKPAPTLDFALEQTLRAAAPLSPRPADRVHTVDLTGTMQGYVWSLNGRIYGQDTPLMVALGERVELVMTNRTMMSHPMHLHGHAFQVVAANGTRFAGALRDTVLVPPKMSVTVAFDADNPGKWAFHCHNLYHMAAGMMTSVQYAGA